MTLCYVHIYYLVTVNHLALPFYVHVFSHAAQVVLYINMAWQMCCHCRFTLVLVELVGDSSYSAR
jgi:hypothetical protein